MALRFKFVNGVKTPRGFRSFSCVSVRPVVVPDRAFTIQELARRMQEGLPMPQITTYQVYEDVGLRLVSQPKDLITAFNMVQEIEKNNVVKENLRKEYEAKKLSDVSKPDIFVKPDSKEN